MYNYLFRWIESQHLVEKQDLITEFFLFCLLVSIGKSRDLEWFNSRFGGLIHWTKSAHRITSNPLVSGRRVHQSEGFTRIFHHGETGPESRVYPRPTPQVLVHSLGSTQATILVNVHDWEIPDTNQPWKEGNPSNYPPSNEHVFFAPENRPPALKGNSSSKYQFSEPCMLVFFWGSSSSFSSIFPGNICPWNRRNIGSAVSGREFLSRDSEVLLVKNQIWKVGIGPRPISGVVGRMWESPKLMRILPIKMGIY